MPPEGVTLHHHWERLKNGNTLILADVRDRDVPEVSDQPIRDEILYEIDGSGEIVWEWHVVDHFDPLGLPQEQLDLIRERGGDWAHANTASVIPANDIDDPAFTPGTIIMSFRHTNTVFIVDRSSGNIVRTMTGQTSGQHDPHIIPIGLPGAGNMLIFDNGYASDWAVRQNRSCSIVKEIAPITRD